MLIAVIWMSALISRAQDVPNGWNVRLDPEGLDLLLRQSLETEPGVMPQQAQNKYLAIMASVWDAKLLSSYVNVSQRLNDKERVKLRNEQEAWLKKREKEASEASKAEEGGSLSAATYSETFIKLTKERNAELQKRQPLAK